VSSGSAWAFVWAENRAAVTAGKRGKYEAQVVGGLGTSARTAGKFPDSDSARGGVGA
jgi:hypothetical protein